MRLPSIVLAAALAAGCAAGLAAADPAVAAANAVYQQAGREIVDQINAKKIDPAVVEAKVLVLVRQAVVAARAYAKAHPVGARLIDAVIAKAAVCDASGAVTGLGPMQELTFAEIEDQWHNMNHFKTVDVGLDITAESNEHFTDPLHAIIHPVMVLRAARDLAAGRDPDGLAHMKAEMDEGLEQMAKLAQ